MKHEHHPFENQIFHAFRKRKKKIHKFSKYLKANGYIVYEKPKKNKK